MKKISFYLFTMLMVSGLFFACTEDEESDPKPLARFTATANEINPFEFTFTNDSENATSYSWDFGDGSTASTEVSPIHTYTETGDYTVTLTATGKGGVATSSKTITVFGLTLSQFLSGVETTGKVWQLEFNALIIMVNPGNTSEFWYGWNLLSVAQRNVVRHHEYIFKPDGSFEFKTKGFTIRPNSGGYATPYLWDSQTGQIYADSESWTGRDGKDLSTWGNNSALTFAVGEATKYGACENRITLTGKGGHIGPMDTGTELAVAEPATSSFYEILRYADGGDQPDTLVLYTPWGGNEGGPGTTRGGLGIITLVSYKDASQIPADEVEPTGKPLEVHDIYDTFEAAGTMTWVQDNNPALFTEDFANPVSGGINTTAHVAKYQRGTQDYANLQFVLSYRMNLATRNVFKMKVYIDAAAAVPTVSMKLQDSTNGAAWETQKEIKLSGQTKGEWIELEFDFSAFSDATIYDKIVVQFGDEGVNKGDGLFYFDDFRLL